MQQRGEQLQQVQFHFPALVSGIEVLDVKQSETKEAESAVRLGYCWALSPSTIMLVKARFSIPGRRLAKVSGY